MKFSTLFALLVLALPSGARAGSEGELKNFFEGRTVILNLEMPATDDGVDVYPNQPNPLDYSSLAGRLKSNGTALYVGDETIITKIKVKKKHIEFQLAGGGFGTFSDGIGPALSIPDVPKSKREKFLERAVRDETNPREKKHLELELADTRDAREAEERHNAAHAARAAEVRRAYLRQVAMEGGSRFNIRFDGNVPGDALAPEVLMAMLGPWIEFPWQEFAEDSEGPAASPAGLPDFVSGLEKGLLMSEAGAIMKDRPRRERMRLEGSLKVTDWLYDGSRGLIELTFVEGVLVRYGFASSWVDASGDKPERLEAEKTAFRRLR